MGINTTCEVSTCENAPLISFNGMWLCGECAVKWNKRQNKEMAAQMEEALHGC